VEYADFRGNINGNLYDDAGGCKKRKGFKDSRGQDVETFL